MPEPELSSDDHDTLVEMRTEMRQVRTELTKLNTVMENVSSALMLMPGRIEGLELRITRSETFLVEKVKDVDIKVNEVAGALDRHITEGEAHADKRITRLLAVLLVVASLMGSGVAVIIEFLIRHG